MVSKRGANVVTLSRRIKRHPQSSHRTHIPCDITDADALAQAFKQLQKTRPPLWAVVNCAGYNIIRKADHYSPAELHRIVDVNLYGVMLVTRFAIPLLKHGGQGKIINMASQTGLNSQENNTAYSAAKAGVVAFSHGVAREIAPHGISVLTVCPGDIESPMMDRALNEFSTPKMATSFRLKLYERIPAGRFGAPAEIAEIVTQLLLIETPFLTGSTIVAAGGRTCH
jgi:NAD(P)-dependent dehydrogenase (short-subunit alcohol dehydrogenase family)